MSEESKYYTPTIEEFHVGFELEVHIVEITDDEEGTKEYFKKVTICDSSEQDDLFNKISIERVVKRREFFKEPYRVKYLDREDIESLGWEYNRYDMDGYCKTFEGDGADHQIYHQEDNHFMQIYNWDAQIIFQGTIKNKSELVKLLKQLGV